MLYTLKAAAKRAALLSTAAFVAVAAYLPAPAAFADALNPLTERSLTLSSSSPGWAYTDGSENSTYAPPNSGANGQKTGNYFSFKVSTDTSTGSDKIKAMSFQYCVGSAGPCVAPGNDSVHGTDTDSTSDLNVVYPSAAEVDGTETDGTGTVTVTSSSKAVTGTGTHFTSDFVVGGTFKTDGGNSYVIASIADDTHLTLTDEATTTETDVTYKTSDFGQVINTTTGDVKAVPGYTNHNPKYSGSGDAAEAAKDVAGNFIVMYKSGGSWVQSTGWTASTSNQEETPTTGQQNTIILQNATGLGIPATTQVKVLFFATTSNYITNPGEGAFFVKINTFKNFDALAGPTPGPENTLADNIASGDVIDGGVTVANVMNQSIQITTKVLETMAFSVGTVNPDTLDSTGGASSAYHDATGDNSHGSCDLIQQSMTSSDTKKNVLELGDQTQESSLSTEKTYATHSYWRLSSNSSAGATVYYSGHTLSNTSGDEIKAIGTTAAEAHKGSEQFGLAIATVPLTGGHGFDDAAYGVDFSQDRQTNKNYENAPDNSLTQIHDTTITDLGGVLTPSEDYDNLNGSYHKARLDPLLPDAQYAQGSGEINSDGLGGPTKAKFAFDPMSDTVPTPIASEDAQVVDCVTAKMRYIANIAATTPAGIYTTKINYIAAPQY